MMIHHFLVAISLSLSTWIKSLNKYVYLYKAYKSITTWVYNLQNLIQLDLIVLLLLCFAEEKKPTTFHSDLLKVHRETTYTQHIRIL